jgi:hypothetical protein
VIAKEVLMGRDVSEPIAKAVKTQTEVAEKQTETAAATV